MDDAAHYYFRNMYRSSNEAVICADSSLNVVFISYMACEMLFLDEIQHLCDIFPNKHLYKIEDVISENESCTFKFVYLYDKSPKKCIATPIYFENKSYVILMLFNSVTNKLTDIEKHELTHTINHLNNTVIFSSCRINDNLERLGKSAFKSLYGQEILRNTSLIRRAYRHLKLLITENTKPADFITLNINRYFDHLIPRIVELIGDDRIQIDAEYSRSLLIIETSYEIFDILIANVITNSVKNTEGMSKIKIRTISHKDNAIILFSDNGRGIPNINELFSRTLDYGNYYNVPTAGTGLYVIKKIAEDHGGTIFAQPSSDGGLTLGIVIPKSPPQNIFKSPEEYPLHETMFSTLAIELSDVIREFKSSIL